MDTLVGQIELEVRLFLREKEALFCMLAFPVFMIVLCGTVAIATIPREKR